MDYTLNRIETDVLALEGQIQQLEVIRQALLAQDLPLNLALEGDALMTNKLPWYGSLVGMHFDTSRPSKDYQVAIEGVIESVWEKIKAFFQKIVEYLKRFWAWITNQHNKVTPEKIGSAEVEAKKTGEAITKAVAALTSLDVKGKGDAVATEDVGLPSQKPGDILNAVTLSHKDHFLSGLSLAEKYILFSPGYTHGLEKLSREFARLRPVDALVKKYKHLSSWLDQTLTVANQVDSIRDLSAYREKLEDFKNMFNERSDKALGYDTGNENDADILSHDIDHFHAARSGVGDNRSGKDTAEFSLEIPKAGDAFIHTANTLDNCFRMIKAVFGEVKTATDDVKALESLFEGLSAKIEEQAKKPTEGNHGARDLVLSRMQQDTALVVARIRMIIKGLAIFPTYFLDAHAAIVKYHRFVIRILDETVKQLTGDYEFREELIRSAMAQVRDSASAFARLGG